MTRTCGLRAVGSAATLLLWVAACGSSDPQPKVEPEITAAPTAETPPDPVPTATATAEVAPPEPASTIPPPSGRPAVSYGPKEKVTETFGATPEAKVSLTDGSVLRIPEWALGDGILITLMVDKKGKKAKGGAGSILHAYGQMPPSEAFRTVSTKGPKFELKMPTAKVGSPNLAIGEVKLDDKGKETVEWKVIAPAKKDDAFATFELTEFTNAYLQITSEAPTP